MNKKTIGRILAALLASVSVFAFAACDTGEIKRLTAMKVKKIKQI